MNNSDQKSLPAQTPCPTCGDMQCGCDDHLSPTRERWQVCISKTDDGVDIQDSNGDTIFSMGMYMGKKGYQKRLCNAHLAASAPALLAALKDALEILDDQLTPDTLAYLSDSVDKMKAAIDQAEGRDV